MVNVISPKVEVIDYGPKILDENGKVIMTPDQLVYAAAGITFKDTGFFDQTREAISEFDYDKITESIILSVGGGHASLATTPGLWFAIKGNSSKLVDSIFTGVTHGSSLMPSGRRIPIAKEQIVIPLGISNSGENAINSYMKASINNIEAYEKLMENGVQKEEAAKIVQYGHRGGGFLFMPLETIVSLSNQFEECQEGIPREGKEVITQLEDFIYSHGMARVYASRLNAPRSSCPNPGIFHYNKNLTEIIERDGVIIPPVLWDYECFESEDRDNKIKRYLERRDKIFSEPEKLKKEWKNLLNELNGIVNEYNNSVSVTTISNSPWRVWGEVKRHRTLEQSAESVYNACQRALEVVRKTAGFVRIGETENLELLSKEYEKIFSMPSSVKIEREKLRLWLDRIVESFETYDYLRNLGVIDSDAIAVVPRGLKLGIEKRFDLYNLTTGYMSLRLCGTCEPEMRRTTEQERDLILNSGISEDVKKLISVKCSYTGFCPEGSYEKRCCKKVIGCVPEYNEIFHQQIQRARKESILYRIKRGTKSWFKNHEHFMR